MSKLFKLAVGLWVQPDFSGYRFCSSESPRVNHSKVDFAALKDAIVETVSYGPHVDILVPNDTIDQGVLLLRSLKGVKAMRCLDFGEAMLKSVPRRVGDAIASGGVLDVRKAWAPLHALEDRDCAPPPVILPFVVLANDFADSQSWVANCRPILGLPDLGSMEDVRSDELGRLPASFKARLETIFGCPYEDAGAFGFMGMDKAPARFEEFSV